MKTIVERIDLGGGLEAVVEYRDAGQPEPPASGYEWDRGLDLPVVEVLLKLPDYVLLRAELRSKEEVFGEELSDRWGQSVYGENMRMVLVTVERERVLDAYHQGRRLVEEAVETLRGVVSARLARLAAREETLRLSREGSPFEGEGKES